MRRTRLISIVETSRNVWRVSYDGRVLGDSPGFSKGRAENEARTIAARNDDGEWEGGKWVAITNVLAF